MPKIVDFKIVFNPLFVAKLCKLSKLIQRIGKNGSATVVYSLENIQFISVISYNYRNTFRHK